MSDTPDLHVDVREEACQLTVAALTGPLDLHTAPSFHEQAIQILDRRPFLLLYLVGVTHCDSSGLNTLLRLHRHAQDTGGRLTLADPPAQMARMLEVTGTDAVLPVYGTAAEARETYPLS
jgi:anti-sigma B factor antagonist